MTANFKQFLEYCNKYKGMTVEFQAWFTNWLYEMAERTIARTKLRTPVDTGALRNAWKIAGVKKNGNNFEVLLVNGQDYASYVEYGTPKRPNWKWGEGAHMLTISMNEIQEQMPARFDQAFTQFLKENGLE